MRLIDAYRLLSIIGIPAKAFKGIDYENGFDDARAGIIDMIKSLPTVDAVQVAPVKIERYDDGQGRCPLCKTDIPFRVVNDKWEFELYCPHCGAKMDTQ